MPGADQPQVFTLRTLSDCRAIIGAAQDAKRAVVIGASFIGLEVAASLRARKLEVDVVAPEKRPLEKVFGPEIGDFVRSLHEEHGVGFHLENTATAIDGKRVDAQERRDDRGAIWWWSASACARAPRWPKRPGWQSTTARP